jgi:hypothetical protein
MLGFKMLFDLFYPEKKGNINEQKPANDQTAAAFWFGTSFENLDDNTINQSEVTENSEYDQTW